MSNEEQNISSESVFDYYKSLGKGDRNIEADLVEQSVREGVIPASLRYGNFRDVYRGVVKSVDDELFYFNHVPDGSFRLVKAEGQDQEWDAHRLLKSCDMGCDLKKADEIKPDTADETEDEETEKAEGGGVPGGTAGAAGSGSPPSVAEPQALKEQARLLTEHHPGGVSGGYTPDLPTRGRQWHEEEPAQPAAKSEGFWNKMDLVKGLAASLQESAPRPGPAPTAREQQYLTEVLGRAPGDTKMNAIERGQYNTWLTKSLGASLSGLAAWRKRHG